MPAGAGSRRTPSCGTTSPVPPAQTSTRRHDSRNRDGSDGIASRRRYRVLPRVCWPATRRAKSGATARVGAQELTKSRSQRPPALSTGKRPGEANEWKQGALRER
jgi:hypothetical protein